MKNILIFLSVLLFMVVIPSNAQVKISDSGSTSPGDYSILELESSTRGFLGPRVTLTDLALVTPLTGAVPAGMLVYNTGGTITNGYFVWNGTKWVPFATGMGSVNVVTKSATVTLLITETFVAASGDITLTLPVVVAADNGLAITVKNVGTYTDQINVVGNSAATIDGSIAVAKLYRWKARTFVAYNGNWLRREKDISSENVFDVSSSGSWTTITEIIEFLGVHMTQEAVVKLDGGTYEIDATQIINLPFHVTIQGVSYGEVFIVPVLGIGNNPLFSCLSPCSFKMIDFDGLGSSPFLYGFNAGQDAIRLETDGAWFEIKDCTFEHFNKTINVIAAVDLWFFESDISDAVISGVELAADAADAITFKTSETDFTNCAKGINMVRGTASTISIQNCSFFCSAGQTGIVYVPATFLTSSAMFITNTAWNNVGVYMSGFDFTLARDKDIDIVNNSGMEDKNPKCKINVLNNGVGVYCNTQNSWYKPNWTNGTGYTVKWSISAAANAGNRFQYLPVNTADIFIVVSGNIQVDNNNETLNIGIVKNGVSGTRYGETTVRTGTAGQPSTFSTVVYLPNVIAPDFFELWVMDATSSARTITVQDLNIFVNSQ